MDTDLSLLDATAQAKYVAERKVSVTELVQDAIDRTERLNPALNAVVTPLYEEALEEAKHLDDRLAKDPGLAEAGPPFLGVPFLMKDLDDWAGSPTSSGSRFFYGPVAAQDSEIAARFRRAGFVVIGKTNTPELGLLPTTEPALFGPTRNPWNLDTTPGGSSGGAAAAVAAGMVAIAHANDGGGSIRIPASCCGLFGLKPSRGRTPGNTVTGLTVNHVVTRSVRDSAHILDAIAGPMKWSPFPLETPSRPFGQTDPAKPLRIAFSDRSPTGQRLHPDVVAAVHDAARLCESLGHSVEQADLPIDGNETGEAFMVVWAASCAAAVESYAARIGRPPGPDELEPVTWAHIERNKQISGSQLMQAWGYLHYVSKQIASFFDTYDVWLTPTLAAPPVNLGFLDATRPDGPSASLVLERTNDWVPFPPLANVTGQPAMSVPLHWNEAGLPIGVHFMGRFAKEDTLLALAGQLEEARPWAHLLPPLHATKERSGM